MKNISSWLLRYLNDKRCLSQSYGKNHKMPVIAVLVYNCCGQNKNNILIHFLNMIKERGFFDSAILYFYIKGHTNNYCEYAFNSLKFMYQKQNVFTFDKCCEILNTSINVEFIQMFHENFFVLELFMNDVYNIPDPKNVNINHILQVKNSRYILVIVKSSM